MAASLNPVQKLNVNQKFTPAKSTTPSAAGPFSVGSTTPPAATNARPASTVVGNGPYTPLASTNVGNVPQSFVDNLVTELNNEAARGIPTYLAPDGKNYPIGQLTDPTKFAGFAKGLWDATDPATQQQFAAKDAQSTALANNASTTAWAQGQIAQIPQTNTQVANSAYNTFIAPSWQSVQQAQAKQVAADNAAIPQVQQNTGDYVSTLQQQEAMRRAGIDSTNAANSQIAQQIVDNAIATNAIDTGYAQNFQNAASAANAQNLVYGQQMTDLANSANATQNALYGNYSGQLQGLNQSQLAALGQISGQASSINANQTGLYNTLSGQAGDINANQTGLFNTLSGQASASNQQQSQANNLFQGQLSGLNQQQLALLQNLGNQQQSTNQAQIAASDQFNNRLGEITRNQEALYTTLQQQMLGLNDQERAQYMQYLEATNPLMAQLVAQGSSGQDVGNQQDVINRYKELSNPEVTAQERFIANQSQQGIEAQEKSSRDALMERLATQGLRSGGLVIAGQQAAQQQLSQERLNEELGIQAQAVQRSMQGLQGYATESNAQRAANDALHQFQDIYAQNEAIRTGNLAGQRNQAGVQNLNDITGRNQAVFDAGSATNQYDTGRAQLGFEADTTTLNNNWARDYDYFNAGTQTYQDNTNRDLLGFNATTATVNNNYARDQSVFNAGTTTNDSNFNRDLSVFNAGTQTNNNNFSRDQAVFNDATTSYDANTARDTASYNAGTQTNNDNTNRSAGAISFNQGINQQNLGNTFTSDITVGQGTNDANYNRLNGPNGAYVGQQNTNSANDLRSQGGNNSAENAAGSVLNAKNSSALLPSQLAGGQVNTAINVAGTGQALNNTVNATQSGLTSQQLDALDRAMGWTAGTAAKLYTQS